METKKILVTGARGQLGSELRTLAEEGPRGLEFIFTDIGELDVCSAPDVESCVSRNGIGAIVNCAAYTAVDKAESDEELAGKVNAAAPGVLARAIGRRGGTMIQISTDYVFDGKACTPYTEDCEPNPASVYGRTKLEGERAAAAACRDTVIIRTAWLYSSFGSNFVKTMLRLGRERGEIGVVADQIGTPTYARDLARAILCIASRPAAPGIYHFTDEGSASWYDFATAVLRLAGISSCKIRPLRTCDYPAAAKRPHYSVLDKTKIKAAFPIEIPHWTESLRECLKLITEKRGQ